MIVSDEERRWRRQAISDGCTWAWRLDDLPPTFRAVEVAGFAYPFPNDKPMRVPLSLRHATVSAFRENIQVLRHGSGGWDVSAYFGSDVSPRDPTLEAIVRTVRFRR